MCELNILWFTLTISFFFRNQSFINNNKIKKKYCGFKLTFLSKMYANFLFKNNKN